MQWFYTPQRRKTQNIEHSRSRVCQSIESNKQQFPIICTAPLMYWRSQFRRILAFWPKETIDTTCFLYFFYLRYFVYTIHEFGHSLFLLLLSPLHTWSGCDVWCLLYLPFQLTFFVSLAIFPQFQLRRCSLDLNYIIRRAKNTVYIKIL